MLLPYQSGDPSVLQEVLGEIEGLPPGTAETIVQHVERYWSDAQAERERYDDE